MNNLRFKATSLVRLQKSIFMKRAIRLAVFLLLLAGWRQSAWAQPTFYMPCNVAVNAGEQICIPVKVKDFTDLLVVQYSIQWDPAILSFDQVQNLNPGVADLDMTDFDVVDAANGTILFDWGTDINGPGVTLPDDEVLFELCFTATGAYGQHTDIAITDDPLPTYVTRVNAYPMDIGQFIDNGCVSIGVDPLTINISSASGNPGEVVCVDLSVADFVSIVGMQFSVQWDTTLLAFESVSTLNLSGFTNANISADSLYGNIAVSWISQDLANGNTLPDGTQIIQLCFTVLGTCGDNAPVWVSDTPTPVEIINAISASNGQDIGILNDPGYVTANCVFPDGITINIPDATVCPGETFFVDLTVEDFVQITELDFSLVFNPNVLQLSGAPTDLASFLFVNSVNTSNASQGIITVEWQQFGFGASLPDGGTLFRLRFQAVGPGGSSSTISIANSPVEIFVTEFGNNDNIGINSNNGLVSVQQCGGVTLVAGNDSGNPGDQICIDINAQDFEDVTELAFTINWEPNLLEYVQTTNYNLAGLDAADFDESNVGSGNLCLNWVSGTGQTAIPGTSLFQVCFNVVGTPGQCAQVGFTDFPCPLLATTGSSAGTDVGLSGQAGEICITNPIGFALDVGSGGGAVGGEVCVPVTVTNFTGITELAFTLEWDETVADFTQVTGLAALSGFDMNSFTLSQTANGQLELAWASLDQTNGDTLATGDTLFVVCFTLVGQFPDCSDVMITSTAQQLIVRAAQTGDTNIGAVLSNGSVCINQFLVLSDTLITPVSCPGAGDGAITITAGGGSGNYTYVWDTDPVQTGPTASGLSTGTYCVTVTDNSSLLDVSACFEVPLSPDAPVAYAGEDFSLACGTFQGTLDGTGSSTGPNYAYQWTALGFGLVVPPGTSLQNPFLGAGAYELAVTDLNTGCVVRDTVEVSAAVTPGLALSANGMVTCTNDTLPVIVTISPPGSYQIQWTTNGGQIVPGTDTTTTAKVTAGGWYYVEVTNPANGCSTIDSIQIAENITMPVADAGPDQYLDCQSDFVTLDGTNSTQAPNYVYQWTALNGGIIEPQGLTAKAYSIDTFLLTVTDTTNGCFAVDEVVVSGDTLKPTANAGPDTLLTCAVTSVVLDGSASTQGANFTYLWTPVDAGEIQAGTETTLNPVILAPGTYQLVVTDITNGCLGTDEVVVAIDTVAPVAEAGVGGELSCINPSLTLDGSGSSQDGSGQYTYQWTGPAGAPIQNANTLMPAVSVPGWYFLTVINTDNGCSATDSVEVLANSATPQIAVDVSGELTCVVDTVLLDASATTGGQLQFAWSGPCLGQGDQSVALATCPGTYSVTVTDQTNGCADSMQVMVSENITSPTVQAFAPDEITCSVSCVEVSAEATPAGATYSYQWTPLDPEAEIMNADSSVATVCTPGGYTVVATDVSNGCTGSTLVGVSANTVPPVADAGTADPITCAEPASTLNGSGSSQGAPGAYSYQWQPLDGGMIQPGDETSLTPTVLAPGTYQLIVTDNQNGCTATDEVTVADDTWPPLAEAGPNAQIGCLDDEVLLDGSASESGPDISYTWLDAAGMPIGSTSAQVSVAGPGWYFLVVRDEARGCQAMDSVFVEMVVDLPPAVAEVNGDTCAGEAMLFANLPDNTTGVWTTPQGGLILEPDNFLTAVAELPPGLNQFIWTLSGGNCENYSADTVEFLALNVPPNAVPDGIMLPDGTDSVDFSVLQNDVLIEGAPVTVSLLGEVTGGSVKPALAQGAFRFVVQPFFAGEATFDYELCYTACPDLCDTATVTIFVDRVIEIDVDNVPNGITPNGDGLNDALVFDVLLANPDRYPDNEIVIFNRWGDIVYRARPYNNDWRGTNMSGQPLPQGTYYYILRLDLDQGEIIRGDITIVR